MKKPLLATLLVLGAPGLLLAQTTTKVKAKSETAGVDAKTKTRTPAATARPATPAAALPAAEPDAAKVDARAASLTANMQKALGLNPQQVEKVSQINLVSVRGVETARLTYRQNVRKMATVIDDIGQARMGALKDVLTPAQFDRYQRKREEKMGVPNAQGAQGTPAPGLPGNE